MNNRGDKGHDCKPVRSGGNSTGTYKPVRAHASTTAQGPSFEGERSGARVQANTITRKPPRNVSYSKGNSTWSTQQGSILSSPLVRFVTLPLAAAAVCMLLGLLISCVAGL